MRRVNKVIYLNDLGGGRGEDGGRRVDSRAGTKDAHSYIVWACSETGASYAGFSRSTQRNTQLIQCFI
ncbi:unnamed protein product [Danaus chrysippus]|uniref:(African queen) hypothetical protein n=1 Tax=Danaus chrysippus TaxID=151541 RepID=A0A8J2QPV6_9NEOP|nr:unnamed protein product [Danaus chrysippus]